MDFIAARWVGIGPACAPPLSKATVAAKTAVRIELDNFMILSVLCGAAWRSPLAAHSRMALPRWV